MSGAFENGVFHEVSQSPFVGVFIAAAGIDSESAVGYGTLAGHMHHAQSVGESAGEYGFLRHIGNS